MAELPPRRRIRDVAMMRAMAHPLRTSLLMYLLSVGPRTASECAAEVGSSPSNCSWHLRHLAELGLVERAEGGDGRERPWRATDVGLDIGVTDDDPGARSAQSALTAAALADERRLLERYLDHRENLPQPWREAVRLNGYALRVTPAELVRLTGAIDELLRPYVTTIRAEDPDDAAIVHVGLQAFPRIDGQGRQTR
jgi:DNA-binding transcriptional ArsR family regulator